MPIIPFSSSSSSLRADWHDELLSNNLAQRLDDGSLVDFPPTVLHLTEAYRKKKNLQREDDKCNRHLNDLVHEHVHRKNGSREVATLACLLEYDKVTARVNLIALRGDDQVHPSYTRFLRCLIVANSIAPTYVPEQEAQVAKALLKIRLGYTEPLSIFRDMVVNLAAIRDSRMLPSRYINQLLAFCQIPRSYELYLDMLRRRCHFASLYRTVSWVGPFMLQQQCQLAQEVLRAQIPELDLWVSWRPDETRLQQWEDYAFTAEQMAKLQPLFYLEGPDVTKTGKPTFKEARPTIFQTATGEPPSLELVNRLLELLDNALHVGSSAINLYIGLCIDSALTDDTVALVDRVIGSDNDECCYVALVLATSLTPNATVSTRMAAMTNALPVLQAHPIMREIFASKIRADLVRTMKTAQEIYRTQLAANMGDNLGHRIYAFGRAIVRATWLHDLLPEDFRNGLGVFPSDDVFRGIMDRLESSLTPSAEKTLKAYLVATLGGTGTSEDIAGLKTAVDAEQEFWITHPDVERNRILAHIRNLPYVQDTDFLRACRQQILVEDLVLLTDMLRLIERDSHLSCIDIVRILARRRTLPINVHHVWVSLVSLMLQHRAEDLLPWACDNLTVTAWFRWIEDMGIIFAGHNDHEILMHRLGFTSARQAWWARLQQEYLTGVEYLDRLQRHLKGGIASIKWLYLQEIPNVQALLDVIVGQKNLGYDQEWILSFFEPSLSAIATLCNCLAAHDQSSSQGRYGIRTILERYHAADPWPDSATAAYMMAWKRSNQLTEDDQKALSLLSELVGIGPSLNPRGLGVIRSKMLKEYDEVIELAREVEGLRIQLSRKDNKRTTALISRLGMQGSRPYIDPEIPAGLSDAIECVGNKEYELCFPLTHLQGHDRKTRGIGSDLFPILTVRVIMEDDSKLVGFCVHLVPHDTVGESASGSSTDLQLKPRTGGVGGNSSGKSSNHTYWKPWKQRSKKPTSRICSSSFNLFTHALAQRLHRHYLLPDVSLQSVYDVVSDTIKSPASECTACGDPLTGLWKPTICTKSMCATEMSRSSLLVRAYGLLIDPPVLDFLLGCVCAAVSDSSGLQLVSSDSPFEKHRMLQILHSFPALPRDETATPFDTLAKIRANAYLANEREQVLAWMSKWFRGCMLSAPPGKRLPIMSEVEQFLLYNSTPECEKAFRDCVQATGSSGSTRSAVRTGDVVFHGSQTARMWKVLTEGLRNMSNTRYMAHGAVNGPGIYLADEPATSFSYSGLFNVTWNKSAFRNKKVLLGCELLEPNPNAPLPAGAKRPPAGTHIVTDESRVLVRYVFICPQSYTMPPARHIEQAMKSTFLNLQHGPGA
ncbi:Poly(ADP-ribose) polymerase, catalytic domain protein [Niveomyces insectorum RCEF 264]|uniref:Poly(ADP-ribose) polymerase, catalytic domain protein n=1 Tax=Niveomyces insectorum RCEF 264 TaxID=1081102 RepID=A0A167QC08_9HYPO|nr:Poly(ADP-ribose) polymerase, catalytic domain protein [Niveomyces insectorum RCEF 264]